MGEVLLWLAAFVVTWIVLLAVVATLTRWRLQRRNRVSPAVKSPAPVTWLWAPNQPARLHRRLQGAVADIHLAPSRRSDFRDPASADELRRELEYQAVELDHHLVIAARHPRRQRKALVRSLADQVAEVEELSVRLSRLSSRPDGTPASGWDVTREPPEVLASIAHQLDLIDAAQAELEEIERAAGLVDVDAVLGSSASEAPPSVDRTPSTDRPAGSDPTARVSSSEEPPPSTR